MHGSLRLILIAVVPLFFSTALMIAGNTLLGTAISVRLSNDGFAVGAIGLVTSMYWLGFMIGTLICPIMVARVGHIRSFAAFAALAAAATLAYPLYVDAPIWGALRILYGICIAALFTIIESWLNARADNENRGKVLSAYMAVYFVAAAGGSLALAVLPPSQFVLFSVVSMTIAISLVPLALTRIQSPPDIPSGRLGPRALMNISPVGVAGCFTSGLLLGTFAALAPVYVLQTGGATGRVALLMMLSIVTGFALQIPIGQLSDALDRRQVILGLAIALMLAAALAPVAGIAGVWPLLATIAILGGLSYSLYPLALAHANDFMEPGQLVPAAASLLLIAGGGSVLGPMLAAGSMELAGPAGLFIFMGAVSTILVGFILVRMRARPSLPNAEQQPSVVQAGVYATQAGIELDPRVEIEEEEPEFDFGQPPFPAPAQGSARSRGSVEAEVVAEVVADGIPPDSGRGASGAA